MKKLFIILPILCLCNFSSLAFDYSDFIINSDSSRNLFILEIFYKIDLTDQRRILGYLGQRADSNIGDFIFGIIDHMTNRQKDRYEYLLRVLLDSVFSLSYEDDELAARVTINKISIDYLVSHLQEFSDPLLRCQIIRIIPFLHDSSSISYIMTEGKHLLAILEETDGMPGALINGEIICLLEKIREIGNLDYIILCQLFITLSRHREVVKTARETINILLARE